MTKGGYGSRGGSPAAVVGLKYAAPFGFTPVAPGAYTRTTSLSILIQVQV